MRRLIFTNQKGGVGKTASVVNLGAALARAGRRTLLVDADPQGNTTQTFAPPKLSLTITDVLLANAQPEDAIVPTAEHEQLFVLPCEPRFANFATRAREMNEAVPQLVMRQRLQGLTDFDYILIDTGPSLDLAVVNALAFADEAWVPVDSSAFALSGLQRITQIAEQLRTSIPGTTVVVRGAFLTMAERGTLAVEEVQHYLRQRYPDQACHTSISRSVKMKYALAHHQSIFRYDPKSRLVEEYLSLTQEILAHERQPVQTRIG
jgi:chromosome partitioning protein